ncbi:flagellar protein FlaG [Bacillus solitudinis]|uniref:flagellar protein FlaG n=1 Tax=Bacillus solitudinis TaxID=2014074 RepID=UPI000C24BA00|nr:flagellar protein FlaG [Bacillus solitudinis]
MEIKVSSTPSLISNHSKSRIQDEDAKVQTTTSSELIEESVKELIEQRKSPQSSKLLGEQIDNMNNLLESSFTSLKFNLHEDLHRYFVQLVNPETEEVVKEIPSEEFLDMVASMLKHAGLIVDKRI